MTNVIALILMITISNGKRTECSAIQGVIGRVVANQPSATRSADLEITSRTTPELYDMKSYYQLIVSITKCEKLFKSAVRRKAVKI